MLAQWLSTNFQDQTALPPPHTLKQYLAHCSSVFSEKGALNNSLHCNENLIYVFPEKELRSLSPNFHIHLSVCDLYIGFCSPSIRPQSKPVHLSQVHNYIL
jgi:hypothetical protein